MRAPRWEKERSAWLLAHSRPGTVRRRRAELLARQARQLTRSASGLGESSMRDDATQSLFRRLLKSDEGTSDRLARLILVPVGYASAWLLGVGGIGIAAVLYRILWTHAPRIGRLRGWPWTVAGVALGIAGWMLIDRGGLVDVSVWPRYMVIDVIWIRVLGFWLWTQLTLGLILTGLYIRETGWAGVPADAVQTRTINADGSFRETPEAERIRLDPLADEDVDYRPESRDEVEGDSAEEETEPMFDAFDDDPVFADEDDWTDEDGPEPDDDEEGPIHTDEDIDQGDAAPAAR